MSGDKNMLTGLGTILGSMFVAVRDTAPNQSLPQVQYAAINGHALNTLQAGTPDPAIFPQVYTMAGTAAIPNFSANSLGNTVSRSGNSDALQAINEVTPASGTRCILAILNYTSTELNPFFENGTMCYVLLCYVMHVCDRGLLGQWCCIVTVYT